MQRSWSWRLATAYISPTFGQIEGQTVIYTLFNSKSTKSLQFVENGLEANEGTGGMQRTREHKNKETSA